ncbi:MAG: MBL fold metallo-hydrolase [Clostridiales Family XIII bacterium]|jgi:phosphoribosyl 1,2-cyclic phosphodiesterase|nr:MBL fold metallo-hydrolase [Clostridiales Family XIII bacterium]
MVLSFCSFSSGSSGNCYLVKADSSAVLVDAGISTSRIMNGLLASRTDPEEIQGILITHEHSDHIRGLDVLSRRLSDAKVYATEGTMRKLRSARVPESCRIVSAGENHSIGKLEVDVFAVSHDAAEPIGFSIGLGGKRVCIITDTGVVTEEMLSVAAEADILVLEANHDVSMLKKGRYPPLLKQRILGREGHLSNTQAAETIATIMGLDRKPRCVLLAHLSRDNNDPYVAEKTVSEILAEMDYHSGRDFFLKPLLRDKMSAVFEVDIEI